MPAANIQQLKKILSSKLKKAQHLSKPRIFPLNFIFPKDPSQAALLYAEIGEIALSLEDTPKAIEYFKLSGDFYTESEDLSQALFSYKRGGELGDLEQLKKAAEYAWITGMSSVGASIELGLAELSEPVEHLKKAVKFYEREKMVQCALKVKNQLVFKMLEMEKYVEAGHLLLTLGGGCNLIAGWCCFYLVGQAELMENLKNMMDSEELAVVVGIENKEKEAWADFCRTRVIKKDLKNFIERVLEPEKDIL